jgi:hypothetical protein
MAGLATVSLLLALAALPRPASVWNIPGHMLFRCHRLRRLSAESRQTIEKVEVVLEKHPWYANQWQSRLQNVPVADRELALFMQAARCIPGISNTHTMYDLSGRSLRPIVLIDPFFPSQLPLGERSSPTI